MTATSLLEPAPTPGPQPIDITRHLAGVADLIELCFSAQLDEGGRGFVRDMRFLSGFGPLLPLLNQWALGRQLWDAGYVWVEAGKIVGSVSTLPSATTPGVWLVANVAVHPEWRQRGIAQALMQATLSFIQKQGGRTAILQVDDDNAVAVHLYEQLGFSQVVTQTAWTRPSLLAPPPALENTPFEMRLRAPAEWSAQWEFATLARPAGVYWNQPLQARDFRPQWGKTLENALLGRTEEHWWALAPGAPQVRAGCITVQWNWPEGDRLILYTHPDYRGQVEQLLLTHALRRLGKRPWPTRIEHPTDDQTTTALLQTWQFVARRTLRWMHWVC